MSVKITNASTVKTTKTTSGTRSSDRYDSGPHACYPTTRSRTRLALFTRPIRGAAQNSRDFYALGRRAMFSRPCPTLVEPVKVTEVGVAMVMITADRSHSAAMARLSLPSASGWAVPVV